MAKMWSIGTYTKEGGYERKGQVGVAFTNDNGSISLKIAPGCSISCDGNVMVSLWPFDKDKGGERDDRGGRDDGPDWGSRRG